MSTAMRFRLRTLLIVLAILPIASCFLFAAENQADPTGTWTWNDANQNAGPTLTLKFDRGKLSGSVRLSGSFQWPLEGATYSDGVVTFNRRYVDKHGAKVVSVFTGTLTGDMIAGTIEYRHGTVAFLKSKWEAKRTTTP